MAMESSTIANLLVQRSIIGLLWIMKSYGIFLSISTHQVTGKFLEMI